MPLFPLIIKVILLVLTALVTFSVQARNSIDSIRIWPAPENTRLVFDFEEQPKYSYFSLSSPQRLVIDFEDTKNLVALEKLAKKDKRIKRIRKSTAKKKHSTRVVLELADKYQLNVFPLSPAGPYGHRLVVDLLDKNRKAAVATKKLNSKRDVIIAVVAGHGGEDPGSIGYKGTYEKKVTLQIAKRLVDIINNEKGFKGVLVRSGDYYVNLNRRTEIARRKQADFLVSIHADAYTTPKPNGGSVWVLSSGRAESELSKWLKNREQNSEMLGGAGDLIKSTNDDNLAKLFADLTKEKSLEISIKMAERVIGEMKQITKMHKKKPQHASFAVLKASDIPSILVETGFISNPKDEKNLISSNHQQKLGKAIFNGIKSYYYQYPPDGTLLASMTFKKHTVAKGESLSIVAQRYNVSIGQLKSANNMRSDVVRIGQQLKIPQASL
jgi:N-acetylmuramoyl-L-alanine amidase